jgi:hypothetical protein
MKNRPDLPKASVIAFPGDAAKDRADAIEHEMCEMRTNIVLMRTVVDGERYTPQRDHLVRSMEAHHEQLDALLFPPQ